MDSGEGDGDAQGGAHEAEEAKGSREEDDDNEERDDVHCALVGVWRFASFLGAPMLVYEFISNRSLEDILHNDTNKLLSLDVRLSILHQSATGLNYMHSETNNKILHGDVKPANILLGDNLQPKISDFGISRLIAKVKEHTKNIIGGITYMDPVYLRTGKLTDRSDVYSFGLVILEVISRKRATHSENNSLLNSFLDCHREGKKATELFDKEIATTGNLEILDKLEEIAMLCLRMVVDQRPSMKEVKRQLDLLQGSDTP
ncbi:LRR receptor-like serine/threonine-protein kinase ERECTA [Triticum dicoccoides]|uniref:LRR receptor-like serine/threonine-protein kinase ERECTA n=1 Tax=Triticum dicoccoides TaxID=85692 RepID=UPI00188F8E38|nr:LRR receptor-like serine/threonine-protein kinase ERECTA [Triticum dicoccoides]